MAGSAAGLFLLAMLVGIALTTAATDRPCGEFPWSPANATVDCDYSYYSSYGFYDYAKYYIYYSGPLRGRCAVNCSDDIPVIGPPVTSYSGPANHYYYCNEASLSWTGTEPWCEDKPCGKFPWSPADATVDCDYSYYSPRSYWDYITRTQLYGGLRGRCEVRCAPPLVTTGAPLLHPDGRGYFYCHAQTATWLGQGPQCQERPCGEFPWNNPDVTVECDYDYTVAWGWPVSYRGRCRVSCLNATMLVGPSGDRNTDYLCSVNNASWTGSEPVCIGGFDNSSVTESEANRVRLVGGEFYGCVELYDDVTQQWGPVTGFRFDEFEPAHEFRMAWADLVCRDVGFTEGLATHVLPLDSSYHWIQTISSQFYRSYSRPSDTGPNFFLNTSSPVSAGGVQHLSDTVGRVVRGDCGATENWQDCDYYLMCLACQNQTEGK
ncbi:Hypp2984 [Branchiostoma lanceolatum]|uniref:Hypp2984 protein n=1 Tax=Branchiostoma lanceolatum TaxID=7740 RepID=A0A8K0EQ28_BRALA|nr:Hypp2984 [Branchiostoma lanceolatum]